MRLRREKPIVSVPVQEVGGNENLGNDDNRRDTSYQAREAQNDYVNFHQPPAGDDGIHNNVQDEREENYLMARNTLSSVCKHAVKITGWMIFIVILLSLCAVFYVCCNVAEASFENTYFGVDDQSTLPVYLQMFHQIKQQCPRGGFQESVHQILSENVTPLLGLLQKSLLVIYSAVKVVASISDNRAETVPEENFQEYINHEREKSNNEKMGPIRELVYKVRVDIRDADQVERLLEGPILENFREKVRVSFNELKKSDLPEYLELIGDANDWTEEEKKLMKANAMTVKSAGEKLFDINFQLKNQDNVFEYGIAAITNMGDGNMRFAFAQYKAEFKFAPIRIEQQEVHEFFGGLFEVNGEKIITEVPVERLGAKTVDRLSNYFRHQTMKQLHAEGVLDRPIEHYDIYPITEDQEKNKA